MTLEELDKALEKTGLDLTNPLDTEARNMVLARHGQSILDSKKDRCDRCWFKERGKCSPDCELSHLPDDPVQVSIQCLSKRNDIQLFPFLCLFMIPVYEELTGRRDTMEALAKTFRKMWRKTHPESNTPMA